MLYSYRFSAVRMSCLIKLLMRSFVDTEACTFVPNLRLTRDDNDRASIRKRKLCTRRVGRFISSLQREKYLFEGQEGRWRVHSQSKSMMQTEEGGRKSKRGEERRIGKQPSTRKGRQDKAQGEARQYKTAAEQGSEMQSRAWQSEAR
jgi:hypothetical protein